MKQYIEATVLLIILMDNANKEKYINRVEILYYIVSFHTCDEFYIKKFM